MKNWIGLLILIVIVAIAALYIVFPGNIKISTISKVNASTEAALRLLSNQNSWSSWWPGTFDSTSQQFVYRDAKYTLTKSMFQSYEVDITSGDDHYTSSIVLLPLQRDSFEIEWKTSKKATASPFGRIGDHNRSRVIEFQLDELLQHFKRFIENTANVYGNRIEETKVRDSIILVTSFTLNHYPTPTDLYSRIDAMKSFLQKQDAHETNSPMLNVDSLKGTFYTRLGIPIDREINTNGTGYAIKRMVLGLILVSEVTGGPYTVKKAVDKVELYISDFKRKSPAIPYESLITDRLKEPDSSKWKTKIYYPVY